MLLFLKHLSTFQVSCDPKSSKGLMRMHSAPAAEHAAPSDQVVTSIMWRNGPVLGLLFNLFSYFYFDTYHSILFIHLLIHFKLSPRKPIRISISKTFPYKILSSILTLLDICKIYRAKLKSTSDKQCCESIFQLNPLRMRKL